MLQKHKTTFGVNLIIRIQSHGRKTMNQRNKTQPTIVNGM